MYGVSPQPAQAPENSNSGSRNCVPRTVPKSTRERSLSGSVSKKAMFSRSARHQRLAGPEVDGLAHRVARRRHRARLDAQAAAGAVLDVDLQRVPGVRQADRVQRRRREGLRRAVQSALVVVPGADHAVRADEAAVAALDAQLGVPGRDQIGDVALLVRGRTARVRAVHRQRADRQIVATAGHHLRGDGADELGRVGGHHRRGLAGGGHRLGYLHALQALQRAVDGGVVALHHLGAALAVGLGDRLLDPGDRLLPRQHAGDGEEAGLQDHVDPAREAGLAGDPARVDHVDLEALGEDLLLDRDATARPRRRPGECGQLSSSVAPGAARPSTSTLSSSPKWWQPTKLACPTR